MNEGKPPDHTCHQNLVESLDTFLNQSNENLRLLIKRAFSESNLDGRWISFQTYCTIQIWKTIFELYLHLGLT